MKAASTTLIEFLENTTEFVRADLYSFTLNGGTVLRYCSAGIPVTAAITVDGVSQGPFTWNVGPPIQDEGVQSQRGTGAASVDVTVLGGDGRFTVNGLDVLAFIDGLGLDMATARIDRAFAASWSDMATLGPVGTFCRFSGYVSEAKELGRTQAVLTVSSWLDVLQTRYPADVFQTSCLNVFGDANCGVNAAALAVTGTVRGAGETQTDFETSLTQPSGYWTLGALTWLTGPNAGLRRSIKAYSTDNTGQGTLSMVAPVPTAPVAGDTFSITPGCSLAMSSNGPNGCQQWQAAANPALPWPQRFRGTPFVPPPTTGLAT